MTQPTTPGPVFSALDAEAFKPPRSSRTYLLCPLSIRQRNRMQRAIEAEAGSPPTDDVMRGILREIMQQIGPDNLGEVLATLDEAAQDPGNASLKARFAVIERSAMAVPAYAELIEARVRHSEIRPIVIARHCLRGWSGPGLPDYATGPDGLVPEDLLDAIPAAELTQLVDRAMVLAFLGPDAVGNSEAPSPSPESPAPTPAG